jgi:hypothetical protein
LRCPVAQKELIVSTGGRRHHGGVRHEQVVVDALVGGDED